MICVDNFIFVFVRYFLLLRGKGETDHNVICLQLAWHQKMTDLLSILNFWNGGSCPISTKTRKLTVRLAGGQQFCIYLHNFSNYPYYVYLMLVTDSYGWICLVNVSHGWIELIEYTLRVIEIMHSTLIN